MEALTDVPKAGTHVVQAGTGRRGRVTGNAGFDHRGRIAIVQWDDLGYEEVVYIHFLTLDRWAPTPPMGEPADISEDD